MNESQLEFQTAPQTQNEKLRDYLLARPGEWIAMPELAKVITPTGIGAAVHSRVNDCRVRYGMTILNKRSREGGVCKSLYLYEPSQPAA